MMVENNGLRHEKSRLWANEFVLGTFISKSNAGNNIDLLL